MDDGSRVWTPEKARADELVGKPIPADWTQKQGDYGPQAFPPRERKGGGFGGGAAAFRNTKEGQAIEQQAMNRRTALMQAVVVEPVMWQAIADEMFEWLQGSPVHSGQPVAHTRPTSSTAEVGMRGATGTAQGSGDGEAPDPCATIADHAFVKGVCKKCGAPRP